MGNRKFERKIGLNKNSLELLEQFKRYKSLPENDELRKVLEFYIKHQLKFTEPLEQFDTDKDLETYLFSNKKYLISTREQIESARDFADEILNLDVLQVRTKVNAQSKTLSIIKAIGLKQTQCENIFDSVTYRESMFKSGFVENFVDCYMRKNVKTYFASLPDLSGFELAFSTVYLSETNYLDFDVEFKIKVDELDEEILTKIGKILMNLPSFC